ncbi:WD40/YVTN/BNR-like repeat-containing protein [Chloroflexota bacterium]
MEAKIVQALAISPNFSNGQTVLAGTQADGVFRSQDGGKRWHPISVEINEPLSVNSIVYSEVGTILIGTGEHGILRSSDRGEIWHQIQTDTLVVLSMKVIGKYIYAGLFEVGLMVSKDDGKSWDRVENLSARRFNWLSNQKGLALVAGSFNDGIWSLKHGLTDWNIADGWKEDTPVLAMLTCEDTILLLCRMVYFELKRIALIGI